MQHATRHELDAFLRELSPEERRLVRSLRALVRRTIPRCDETMLWGGISYHRPEIGGRVKGSVCLIGAKHGQVEIGFIHGARLDDPERLLRGSRLSKRFVPIRAQSDVDRPALANLIRAAAAITW